jgi:hypothetical protein
MSDTHKVGYRKPPKHGQFQKGQSGNPKGRPKGATSLKTDLAAELHQTIDVKEGGAAKAVSKQRAVVKRLLQQALQGDTKAMKLLIALLDKHDLSTPEGPPPTSDAAGDFAWTEEDAKLDRYLEEADGKTAEADDGEVIECDDEKAPDAVDRQTRSDRSGR